MQDLNNCGCCEGVEAATPVQVNNRPGLSAINYRVGNHSSFKDSLLARLSSAGLPALRQLTTRSNDDFTIAFLDAWATVSDVLTFYQERIANESYLGTATEQISMVQLARLIGYELRPGVAASTYLAFTIDTPFVVDKKAPTANPISIDIGTKVQSVPGQDEKAQTFETIEPIKARAEWNALKPRLARPQLSLDDNYIMVVDGTANDLKAGDILLTKDNLKVKKIRKLQIDDESKTTWLYTTDTAVLPSFTMPSLLPNGDVNAFPEKTPLTKAVMQNIASKTWSEENLSMLIQSQGWPLDNVMESLTAETTKQSLVENKLFVFRKRASVFGYNALKEVEYDDVKKVPKPQSQWTEWPLNEDKKLIYLDTTYEQVLPGSYIAVQKSSAKVEDADVYAIENVDVRPRSAYGLSAKSTAISISSSNGWWSVEATSKSANSSNIQVKQQSISKMDKVDDGLVSTTISAQAKTQKYIPDLSAIRSTTVHVQSAPLVLSQLPIVDELNGDSIMLNGYYPGLAKGRAVILSGQRSDLQGGSTNELCILKNVLVVQGFTVLVFDKALTSRYIRSSVIINANTALATHGETVREVLGSGDSSKAFQKFVLKQPPLTFISATSPSGTKSTLEIRVNDLLWYEVPSLFERGSGEHIYITRQDSAGNTTVTFGDGKNGARIPTGQENIKATYRKGIGTGGQLKADQLSQLVTRPLGVKSATNPLLASGAQDRELLEDAKRNARLTIYTLGRIVSLQDYEDFARAFAGISKSLANWSWNGQKRCIFITVAGYNGAAVERNSFLYNNLLEAIQKSGIPDVPVSIDSFQARFFKVAAKIKVHPDYITADVLATVDKQLRTVFSFASRAFGQPVTFSEVVSVMQNVAGVIAVDIDQLYRSDNIPTLITDRIEVAVPRPSDGKLLPAELLTIDARPIDLKTML